MKSWKFCLPDHSFKARDQMSHHFKNELTGEMYFLGFPRVCYLCALPFLYLPLGCSSSKRNHTNMLISLSTFNIIWSACATLGVLDKHRYDTSSAIYKRNVHWSGCGSIDNILRQPFVLESLQPHFDRLQAKLYICHTPFGEVLNRTACSCKFTWQYSPLLNSHPNRTVTQHSLHSCMLTYWSPLHLRYTSSYIWMTVPWYFES